ncbi:hypothetical protein M413DRAFT_444040 [Hebeloma cylindrosporum]|uniref:Probable RNA polymerase II nuclear localization protein SLC7A6OS n=1 Tax=Hebeloma cylindrosporum TaxID=76867 RepID=A0A0C2YQF4_HEBCY|nr:hypothetical protein M413DRAFT_444040 [Hebeloma cylindrosporum h7]
MQNVVPNIGAPTFQSSTPSSTEPFTILRIKRKRNEEPLDALVIESRVRRKKSRGGIGLFQYAQTVEDDSWDDARRRDIQEKISRLAVETSALAEQLKPAAPLEADVPPSPVSRIKKDEAMTRRYTIVDNEEPTESTRRLPTAPPKVLSAKDLEKNQPTRDFKMYDAVPTIEEPLPVDNSEEMDKFLPMLNSYLRIHNIDPNDNSASTPGGIYGSAGANVPSNSSSDDYVWDVFYHRPATLSEWNEVANIGTVTGLPPSFGDGYDSMSDSDEEFDEADEDSNAEEYYKNDYPEEENSDEFHENSDYEDMMEYNEARDEGF